MEDIIFTLNTINMPTAIIIVAAMACACYLIVKLR